MATRYPYPDNGDRITLTLGQPPKGRNVRAVNFNYEFDFVNWSDFEGKLDRIQEIGEYADTTLTQLLGAL